MFKIKLPIALLFVLFTSIASASTKSCPPTKPDCNTIQDSIHLVNEK